MKKNTARMHFGTLLMLSMAGRTRLISVDVPEAHRIGHMWKPVFVFPKKITISVDSASKFNTHSVKGQMIKGRLCVFGIWPVLVVRASLPLLLRANQ